MTEILSTRIPVVACDRRPRRRRAKPPVRVWRHPPDRPPRGMPPQAPQQWDRGTADDPHCCGPNRGAAAAGLDRWLHVANGGPVDDHVRDTHRRTNQCSDVIARRDHHHPYRITVTRIATVTGTIQPAAEPQPVARRPQTGPDHRRAVSAFRLQAIHGTARSGQNQSSRGLGNADLTTRGGHRVRPPARRSATRRHPGRTRHRHYADRPRSDHGRNGVGQHHRLRRQN